MKNKGWFLDSEVSMTLEKISGETSHSVNINAGSEDAIVWALAELLREAESVTDVPVRKLLAELTAETLRK